MGQQLLQDNSNLRGKGGTKCCQKLLLLRRRFLLDMVLRSRLNFQLHSSILFGTSQEAYHRRLLHLRTHSLRGIMCKIPCLIEEQSWHKSHQDRESGKVKRYPLDKRFRKDTELALCFECNQAKVERSLHQR